MCPDPPADRRWQEWGRTPSGRSPLPRHAVADLHVIRMRRFRVDPEHAERRERTVLAAGLQGSGQARIGEVHGVEAALFTDTSERYHRSLAVHAFEPEGSRHAPRLALD